MKVANKGIIRKLTMRIIGANKWRNFFIVAAITLTAFMITFMFSVGASLYETVQKTPFLMQGDYSHAYLSGQSEENMEAIRSLGYVRYGTYTYRAGTGYLAGFEDGLEMITVNEDSWRHHHIPVFTDIIGSVAKDTSEIMLSRAHLKQMGIEQPFVGMEIPMAFDVGEYAAGTISEHHSETFILAAIYTESVRLRPGNPFTPIFVSESFAERYGHMNIKNMEVRVIFTNQSRAVEYARRLAQDMNLDDDSEVNVHVSLSHQADTGSSTIYAAIAILIASFMTVGFMLIYNVMNISITRDVRFYGLLKTIGTTPRQLRRIVNGQVLLMYTVGLFIGLAAAVLTTLVIIPSLTLVKGPAGAVISFSPLIYLGGAVFTLIAVYLGAWTAARKAARISPVEAAEYTGDQKINKKPRFSVNGKPALMAWRNLFRERKRALIVLLSLFIGSTVFITFMSIANSMDTEGLVADSFDHDICIAPEWGDSGLIDFDRDFIEEITNLTGVREVRELTFGLTAFMDYPQEMAEADIETLGHPPEVVFITGIGSDYFAEINKTMKDPADLAAFERGEIVLVDEAKSLSSLGSSLYDHFPVGTKLYLEVGDESHIPVNTQIDGYHNIRIPFGIITSSRCLRLIMSNTFLESIAAVSGINFLCVNVEEGMYEQVYAAMSDLVDVDILTMFEARRKVEENRMTLLVLGVSISSVLALVGLFNFISLISVGLMARKREFAALESMGMGKGQMRLMLRWEGMIYWIVTIAASVTAGTAIAYGLFRLVANQSPIEFPQFNYPLAPVAIFFCFIVLICTVTPEICYRNMSKRPLAERLRETESIPGVSRLRVHM
ncbi:MAG: ABC transporter permease [Peptococcaceae bacterium]|nr:ABC transporter permease [Peptococcaceae bacterium]